MEYEKPEKINIYFDEVAHKYTDDYGTNYLSCTQLISRYEVPFDREYWLQYKANELGISKEELSAEWDNLTTASHIKGNAKHKELEDSVNYSYKTENSFIPFKGGSFGGGYEIVLNRLEQTELAKQHNDIYVFLVDLIKQGFRLYAEKRVYNRQLGLCGTIDLIAIKGLEFYIIDWKTNKEELKFNSGYYKKKWVNGTKVKTNQWVHTDDRLKYPLNHLQQCKGTGYVLQLNLYAFLTELFGFKNIGIVLWHIRDTDKKYVIKNIRQDIDLMLSHYYENK